MAYSVRRFPDAGTFLDRARPWLLEREAENNLIIGVALSLMEGGNWYEPPLYLATVELGGQVVGAAFRTPPHKFGLTRMPLGAVGAVVNDSAQVYGALPAILGPADVAMEFGARWGQLRGVEVRPGMAQRIYQLDAVIPPPNPAPGGLRYADAGEADLLAAWADAFQADTGIHTGDPTALVNDLVGQDRLFVWDDGGAVSMAAAMGDTPSGARIGFVYTPPEFRGRGYASVLTARLSQALLDGGRRFVCLYADQAAKTPNKIYRQIGYRPVCDVTDVDVARPDA